MIKWFGILWVVSVGGISPLLAMEPGNEFNDCDVCPTMVVVPAGSFTMGSPASETGHADDEAPQHQVTLSRDFAVGKFEITLREFAAFVSETEHDAGNVCWTLEGGEGTMRPGRSWQNTAFEQNDNHPVTCVNWDDAQAYVAWLNSKTDRSYRLLSEAEWEYAARAGTTTAYYWGSSTDDSCDYANGADLTAKAQIPGLTVVDCHDDAVYTAEVGSYRPNAFGLYDMLGNVWEWTEDCWNGSYEGAPADGSAWVRDGCGNRLLRSGSWCNAPGMLRSANRFGLSTFYRNVCRGFRVARTLD